MSQTLPNMLETTLKKLKELMDVNTVVGDPITTPEGVTILPVCKVSYGVGGGGSDIPKSASSGNYPFGGGAHRLFDHQRGLGAAAAHWRAPQHHRRPGGGAAAGPGGQAPGHGGGIPQKRPVSA